MIEADSKKSTQNISSKKVVSKKKEVSKTKVEYEVEIDPVALMSVYDDSEDKELNYTQK